MMALWHDSIFKLYIAGYNGRYGLLPDDFNYYRRAESIGNMRAGKAHPHMIPPHYTWIL